LKNGKEIVDDLGRSRVLQCVSVGTASFSQKTKGKTRLAATKYLMTCINQPNCAGLAGLLKDPGPADAKAWDSAIAQASVLNEMSYVLMEDDRCPDAVWAGAAKNLREGSAKVVAALEQKDLKGANEAFATVTGACGTCHKAHKGS
jgi:cytochrome c556